MIEPLVKGDPDDDNLIALAVSHQAAALVTGDKAVVGTHVDNLRILSPRGFLDWVVLRG